MDGTPNSMDMSLSKLLETVKDREAWRAAFHEVTELDTIVQLNNNSYLYGKKKLKKNEYMYIYN